MIFLFSVFSILIQSRQDLQRSKPDRVVEKEDSDWLSKSIVISEKELAI